MARILGVEADFDRLLQISASKDVNSEDLTLGIKSRVLQKILIGYLEVRKACDKNDRELSYSYNIMRREQRKQDLINQFFTLANFAQLGTLYTLEPFLRLNNQFQPSGICTQIGSGVGLILPVVSIVQQKTARAHHTSPPPIMHHFITGGPVDASDLPEYVERYLEATAPNSTRSRKEEMFALWKTRFEIDATRKESLCSLIDDGKPKEFRLLKTRILLLWSLRTFLLDMDYSLLVLLQQVESTDVERLYDHLETSATVGLNSAGLNASAMDAARLLKIETQVKQLLELKQSTANSTIDQKELKLEVLVLERILSGALETRVAADQLDAEINYASDVVLAELLAKRGRALQRNYEANFIQAGTFGSIAGLSYLKHLTKVGNEMFVISGGIGTALSANALWLMRGGRRPIDTQANSLITIFDVPSADQYRFSSMITKFLNSPAPGSKDETTRAQALLKYWKEDKITTVKLINKKALVGLAGAPPSEYDTIKLATNRISMLHGLLAHIELLDSELLNLARATEFQPDGLAKDFKAADGKANYGAGAGLSSTATEAANLLGLQTPSIRPGTLATTDAFTDITSTTSRLQVIRKVMTEALDVRATSDILDSEISYEYDVLDRMTRNRDHAVSVTNNINFFQLNVLAIIIDGTLGLSGNPRHVRASNMLNIVSGLAVGGLALLTVVEQRGGGRPVPANPNMVGQCLGIGPANEYRFSPAIWKFINDVPPGSQSGQTRVQLMMSAWKEIRSINVNMDRQSTREKISAYGPAHTRHSETIKLLKNRLNMLFDVRGIIGLFDDDLDDLLRSVN
jgi:hypothetical protein